MKKIILCTSALFLLSLFSCGDAQEIFEHKAETNEDTGLYRTVKYYSGNGILLFEKTMQCSISRNHSDTSGIIDLTLVDTASKKTIDFQGSGTLILEEVPVPENKDPKK